VSGKGSARFRPHPWHGLPPGPDAPRVINAFVEITPFDVVKYEVDKATGYLRVDRPQRGSASPPTLYGFVPRTYCGPRVAALSPGCARGDGDPLDVCVISERPIARAEVIVEARVVGGIRTSDRGEADDKIVAILANDAVWDGVESVQELPGALVERLRHYFATYKLEPGGANPVVVAETYHRAHALRVIEAALADYSEAFPD
jgi:inorganic pyrophosphatase